MSVPSGLQRPPSRPDPKKPLCSQRRVCLKGGTSRNTASQNNSWTKVKQEDQPSKLFVLLSWWEEHKHVCERCVCACVCSHTNEMLPSKVRNTKWGRSELCLKTWSFLLSLINLKQQLSDNPPTVWDQSSEVLYWKPGFNTPPPHLLLKVHRVWVGGGGQPAVWILYWSLTFRYKLLDIFDSVKDFPPLLKVEMADLLTLPWRSATNLLGHY